MINAIPKWGLAALCCVTASIGVAQNAPEALQERAEGAVKLRKAVFDVQDYAFASVRPMLRGSGPFDAMANITAAQRIEVTALMIPDVFKFDTRNFKVTTRALDGIWNNMADFEKKARDLHDAAVNLEAAAKIGDRSMTTAAAVAVGKACGACHDEFRAT